MRRTTLTTDRVISNNIKAWLDASTRQQRKAGKAWYKEAQRFTKTIAKRYKVDRYIVAAVTSALSPNNKWERNKEDAESMIKAFTRGEGIDSFKCCTYNANKRKGWSILEQGTKIAAKSPKTHAFAMNIGRLSDKHVTIDKWHIRACLCKPKEGITATAESVTPIQYRRIEAITARIAEENKMKAYELQAIVWVTIKHYWGR